MKVIIIGEQGDEIGRIEGFQTDQLDYEIGSEEFLQKILNICGTDRDGYDYPEDRPRDDDCSACRR
jgi:hypothetical protein